MSPWPDPGGLQPPKLWTPTHWGPSRATVRHCRAIRGALQLCVPRPRTGCSRRPRRTYPTAAPADGQCLPEALAPAPPSAPTGVGWWLPSWTPPLPASYPAGRPWRGHNGVRVGLRPTHTLTVATCYPPPHHHHGCLPLTSPPAARPVPKLNAPAGLGDCSWSNSRRHFPPFGGYAWWPHPGPSFSPSDLPGGSPINKGVLPRAAHPQVAGPHDPHSAPNNVPREAGAAAAPSFFLFDHQNHPPLADVSTGGHCPGQAPGSLGTGPAGPWARPRVPECQVLAPTALGLSGRGLRAAEGAPRTAPTGQAVLSCSQEPESQGPGERRRSLSAPLPPDTLFKECFWFPGKHV